MTRPNPAAGAASMTTAIERAREAAAEYIRDNFGPKMANLTAKGNAFEGMIDAFHRAIVTAEARGLEHAAEIAEAWGFYVTDCGEPEDGKIFSGTLTVDNRRGNEAEIAAAIRAAKDPA